MLLPALNLIARPIKRFAQHGLAASIKPKHKRTYFYIYISIKRCSGLQAWSEGLSDVLSPSARNLPPLAQLVAAEDITNAGAIAMALPPAQVDRCACLRCIAQSLWKLI